MLTPQTTFFNYKATRAIEEKLSIETEGAQLQVRITYDFTIAAATAIDSHSHIVRYDSIS